MKLTHLVDKKKKFDDIQPDFMTKVKLKYNSLELSDFWIKISDKIFGIKISVGLVYLTEV